MKISYNYTKNCIKWIFITAYVSAVAFLSLSIITFNYHDPSFLCIYDTAQQTTNWCGQFGAYCASFFIGFFGSASYYLLCLLLYFGYMLLYPRARGMTIEQICAAAVGCLLMPVVVEGVGNYLGAIHAGGAIGAAGLAYLKMRIDNTLLPYILISVTVGWLCIVTQNGWIHGGIYLVRSLQLVLFHPVMLAIYHICYSAIRYVVLGTYRLIDATYKLLTGHEILQDKDTVVAYELEQWLERVSKEKSMVSITPSTPIKDKEPITEYKEKKTHDNPLATFDHVPDHSEPYAIPIESLFKKQKNSSDANSFKEQQDADARTLEAKLERFGIYGKVVHIQSGPVITHFSYEPSIDTKVSRIVAFEDDLALALQAMSVRIIAPVPGTSLVGFEVARKERRMVLFSQGIRSTTFVQSKAAIPLLIGEDSTGSTLIVDLASMPHLLIAGSTGSGKSIALNTMLISMLCRNSPEQLRLLLIDPKRLEFASYAGIGHLLQPIITDPRKVMPALTWVVKTMEERYELMAKVGVRNVFDFQKKAAIDKNIWHSFARSPKLRNSKQYFYC